MKKIVLLVMALFVGAVVSVEAQEVLNYIQVIGNSEIKVEPNSFTLRIVINEQATKGKVSVASVENDMKRSLKALGVDTKNDLKISDISSLSVKNRDALTTASYNLSLDEASKVSAVINSLRTIGITSVDLVKATNTSFDSYRADARRSAVADAKSKAAELALALGQEVGACFQLVDNTNFYAGDQLFYSRVANGANESVASDIEFRDLSVKGSVVAKFILVLDEAEKMKIVY